MMRPLKLAALSVVLLAVLLLLIGGTFLGVMHGAQAIGIDEPNAKATGILLAGLCGMGWFCLFAWATIEAAWRMKD